MGFSPVRPCPGSARVQARKEHVCKQDPISSDGKEHVLGLTGQVSKDYHKIIESMSCEVGRRPQLKCSYQNKAKKHT